MNYSNLYINGCSFTKGHHLSDKDTWPVKLSQTLGLELHNHAENGQSMQSIAFSTFLIVGFALHNTTEGIAIAAPMSRGKLMIGKLLDIKQGKQH